MGMEMSFLGVGIAEVVLLLSGGGLLGMPPGERDALLLRCPPADAVLYVEWAERSSGKPEAPGIDGLAADPEIRSFLQNVERAILAAVEEETAEGGPEEQVLGKALPPLVKSLLMRPGCLYVSFDKRAADKPREGQDAPIGPKAALLLGLRATLIVNGGDDADRIAESVNQILELLPAEGRTNDLQKQPIPLPLGGAKLTVHRHKKYFIVGFGEGTVEAAVLGISGKAKGLNSNERFKKAMKRVEIERTAGVTWIDVKEVLQTAGESLGAQGVALGQMAMMLAADAIDSVAISTGVVDGQIHSRTFISAAEGSDGILALAAGRGIKPADLSLIPADADLLIALSLSAPKILTAVKGIVGKADQNSLKQLNELISQLEQELDLSLEKDAFKAFGDLWVFHDSPAAGGLLFTSLVGSLEVRDSQKAGAVFAKLMKVLKESLPGEQQGGFRRRGASLAQSEFLGRTIYYVNIVGEDDVPFAPAFCITAKQLLVAPHPQALKAHLRFLDQKKATNFASKLAGQIAVPDGKLLCLTHVDSKSMIRFVYAFTPYLAQVAFSMIQSTGAEIDIFSLPSARAILPYVGNSGSTVVRTPEGILFDTRQSLPIPGGAGVLLNMPMMMLFGVHRSVRVIGMQQQARPVARPVRRAKVRPNLPAAVPAKIERARSASEKRPAKRHTKQKQPSAAAG